MINLLNPHANDLDEIVFEHRNRAYGAYALRKSYDTTLTRSFSSMILFLGAGIGIAYYLSPQKVSNCFPPETIDSVKVISTFEDNFIIELPRPEGGRAATASTASSNSESWVMDASTHIDPPNTSDPNTSNTDPNNNNSSNPAGTSGTGGEGLQGNNSGNHTDSLPGTDDNEIVAVPGIMPEFPGGIDALQQYFQQHLRYPDAAYRVGKEGKVVVSFVVDRKGAITDVNVERGIGFDCDEEAIRVIRSMPRWTPGKQNGRNVSVRFVLPVSFRLAN